MHTYEIMHAKCETKQDVKQVTNKHAMTLSHKYFYKE